MREIAIYVEGGKTAQQSADLRTGLDALFCKPKQAARARRLGWKLVPCSDRDRAYRAFINASKQSNSTTLSVLLVDSEEPISPELANKPAVNAKARTEHVAHRDGWNLQGVSPDQVHLMVQCMEAWIVADPEALDKYYGQGFRLATLPARTNLEDEAKADLLDKLAKATKGTLKGEYLKIKHASKLLGLVAPHKVAARCPRFRTFVAWLENCIAAV